MERSNRLNGFSRRPTLPASHNVAGRSIKFWSASQTPEPIARGWRSCPLMPPPPCVHEMKQTPPLLRRQGSAGHSRFHPMARAGTHPRRLRPHSTAARWAGGLTRPATLRRLRRWSWEPTETLTLTRNRLNSKGTARRRDKPQRTGGVGLISFREHHSQTRCRQAVRGFSSALLRGRS